MAVAYSEVMAMRNAARNKKRPMATRHCPVCETAGLDTIMVPHKPLPFHHWCATCFHIEVEWRPILRRVEMLLEEYTFALIRAQQEPTAPIAQYMPMVAGGEMISQQEVYAMRNAQDKALIAFVDQVMKGPHLTDELRQIIQLRYFDRWPVAQVARKMSLEAPTVYEKLKKAMKVFAREKGWAISTGVETGAT